MIIGDRYHQNPFEKGTLFLFCGRRSDRIKGLLWMGDGFLQLYKRLEAGSLSWPRTSEEAEDLTEELFRYLMLGLNPLNPKVREVTPQKPPDLCAKHRFFMPVIQSDPFPVLQPLRTLFHGLRRIHRRIRIKFQHLENFIFPWLYDHHTAIQA